MRYLFTSEAVSEGHPDKLCDLISDSCLDAVLAQDPMSRVAVETFATTNFVLVGGEVTTKAKIDVEKIVRKTLTEVGYTSDEVGIDANNCKVTSTIHEQSPDIAQGVDIGAGLYKEQGAGDQGMMFGYACKQTEQLMPLPIVLAQNLVRELTRMRKQKELTYLRPDSKSQVTVEYQGSTPIRVETVVISTQHSPDVAHETIKSDIIGKLIKKVIPAKYLDSKTKYFVNPTGRFVVGGPHGDTGLTGRKIIVDTYGGWARHGGGAFSGKDCTKVDRSAAYMARYIAKNLVGSGLAEEAEIQLAYAIGVAQPVSVFVDTKGTSKIPDEKLSEIIVNNFDLTPAGIIKTLNLRSPIYKQTAAYGHFGRLDLDLPWERLNKVEDLIKAADSIRVKV